MKHLFKAICFILIVAFMCYAVITFFDMGFVIEAIYLWLMLIVIIVFTILTIDCIQEFVLYLKRKPKHQKENKKQVKSITLIATVIDKDFTVRQLRISDDTLISALNKLSDYCTKHDYKLKKLDTD